MARTRRPRRPRAGRAPDDPAAAARTRRARAAAPAARPAARGGDRLGDGQPERRPDRAVRARARRLVVRAVVPAQRPADARRVGRPEELPPADRRPAVLVLGAAHRRLHGAVRPDHPGPVAAGRRGAEPADPRHHRLPARGLHPGRDVDDRDRRDLHLADGPGLRADQRRPAQGRPADVPVLRLAGPGAARRRDHDGLGLGRLRCADLPGRAAGHPAGPDRRRADRRLHQERRRSGGSRSRCCDRSAASCWSG